MIRKIIFITILFFSFFIITKNVLAIQDLRGRIVLQVESHGEAGILIRLSNQKHYLGTPDNAFDIMRELGIGITNSNLNKIPVASDSLAYFAKDKDSDNDGYTNYIEMVGGYNPYGPGLLAIDESFSVKNKGKIFLQVESHGEAWYVDQVSASRYYLGRPLDAFNVMRNLGLGISNSDFSKIGEKNSIRVVLNAPFTPQAPFGNWNDPRQEDGCEEASVLIAVSWAKGENFTKQEALDKIINIADWEKQKYGHYSDTSAYDTSERIIKGYFNFYNFEYQQDFVKNDIIKELDKGNLIIVPIDGTKVGNPYYTQPGPLRHMLVITGYDLSKNVFITNDPGTKRGQGFEYDMDRFFDSIRDYPTGVHPEVKGNEKAMIIIRK